MPIKLVTANIEGDKHFDRVFPFLSKQAADVVCLQEVFEADLHLFTEKLGGSIFFAPLTKMTLEHQNSHAPRGLWGVAIWLRDGLVADDVKTHYYRGDATQALQSADPGMGACRAVLVASCNTGAANYTIATTHFTWTPDGEADDRQRADYNNLMEYLENTPDLILCGDFNAPRGGEVFTAFTSRFTDNLPSNIDSTIDPVLHRLKDTVRTVVDTVFSTDGYRVENVVVYDGVSDHKAIACDIAVTQLQ